jgi:ketosteroid isomerase-like protein
MKKILFFVIIIFSFAACNLFTENKTVAGPDEKQKMMDADRAFSKFSVEKGMKNAFLEYIDSNGVLLKPNQFPIVGADAIDYLIQENDSSYTLQWEPRNGAVAKSGELGYTYGLYALKPSGKDTTIYGTYVSIWKKQLDGSWKFVLDSGNEGVGESNSLDSNNN